MKSITILFVMCLSLLQGCAGLIVGGAAAGIATIHDRRTVGTVIEDQSIELKALSAFHSDRELAKQSHINVTSYNGVVLLTGEAPSEELRQRAQSLLQNVKKVRRIHNEIVIAAPSSMLARSSDSLLTAKAKTRLASVRGYEGFDPTRVKIVTENGSVFLLGLLRHDEADAVVDSIRTVPGVQRVVKIFEYLES